MKTTLNKITDRAKQIRRAHPRIEWKDAIKKASSQLKRGGQIGKTKKKRVGNYSFRETSPVKKKRNSIINVSRNKSGEFKKFTKFKPMKRSINSLNGISEAKLIGQIREKVEGTMGKAYVSMNKATKAAEKRKFNKIISECKKKLRRLK